jgi:hypothetical protein
MFAQAALDPDEFDGVEKVRTLRRVAQSPTAGLNSITEVEAGRGIALATPMFKLVAGKRLLYRPLTGTMEVGSVGITRVTKGDVTPAGEKFCEILRKIFRWRDCD